MKAWSRSLTFATCAAVFLLSGCRHYSIEIPDEPQRIQLGPVLNESGLPRLIAPLNRNLREAIAHDPNWQLVSSSSAPTLNIRVTSAQKSVISRNPNDTGRPLSMLQTIDVELSWDGHPPDSWGQKTSQLVQVEGILYTQPGLLASQDGLIAELAERLVQEILMVLNAPPSPPGF